jgi:hypothetical protein
MNHEEKRKYIEELFKYVDTESILVIREWNTLERLRCPFIVKARRDVGLCKAGNYYRVEAVKVDIQTLKDVYIIKSVAYLPDNFTIADLSELC